MGREGVSVGLPACDIVPHSLSQAIVVVTCIVDRQKSPVFGVQHEEQSIQENQGGFPDFCKILACGVRERLYKIGEDMLEHHTRKILRDPLFVPATLCQGGFQKPGLGALFTREGVAAKQKMEDTEAVFVVGIEQCFQVSFKVATGAGPGTVVI